MNVFTLGFTQKNAEQFFGLLRQAGVKRVLDVRLNRTSQLAGFSRQQDLPWLLNELCGCDYQVLPELAPEKALLQQWRKQQVNWQHYEDAYLNTLARRQVERQIDWSLLDGACLLCSEHEPHFCHRRVALEYLQPFCTAALTVTHLY